MQQMLPGESQPTVPLKGLADFYAIGVPYIFDILLTLHQLM
jgi:hypothetical protein